jgi:ATP-dependent DNA helicase DinG
LGAPRHRRPKNPKGNGLKSFPSLEPVSALVAGRRKAFWLSSEGEPEDISLAEAKRRLDQGQAALVCHKGVLAHSLGADQIGPVLDVLELFAFVFPARFCLPTPKGLAATLGVPLPATLEQEAECLFSIAHSLLEEWKSIVAAGDLTGVPMARVMERAGWPWGKPLTDGIEKAAYTGNLRGAFEVWSFLDEWREGVPEPADAQSSVSEEETLARLEGLLGSHSEDRPQQSEYAKAVSRTFDPRDQAGCPNLVLAEAGTGVGKTLAYIASASVWAEKNKGSVWISTYTRNLQRQLDAELERLYPDPFEKVRRVVVRKGRENYFCLLNFEEAVARAVAEESRGGGGKNIEGLGLVARWALASRDGDMLGGDFPAWLASLLGRNLTIDLTDTRGECIYSSCSHYRKCFIEASIRRARRARIVVANHALVMIQTALLGLQGGDGGDVFAPSRYVFDEGHHIFDASDQAFSAHLSGMETAELRRWLLGPEKGGSGRNKGLETRISDLLEGDDKAQAALRDALRAGRALPGLNWRQRLAGGTPKGAAEAFLSLVRKQVYARTENGTSPYSLEAPTKPLSPDILLAASALDATFERLEKPVCALIAALSDILDDKAADLDTPSRVRIEAVRRSLMRRGLEQLRAWRSMLSALAEETPPEFVDWFSVERLGGNDLDVGLRRHWLDPTEPFAEAISGPAHGLTITSATLCDTGGGDENEDAAWGAADFRCGARHFPQPLRRVSLSSPFDYQKNAKVLVVSDVNRNDATAVASAYRELFIASSGGALGLFTAIHRLREIYQRISDPLDHAGLPLLAQHVSSMDTGTLIDIFRAEENACLLGTDAVRDGIDVPGRSLRLIVFDRVPWPRPDIVHRYRREAFGGRAYEEMLVRLRLKQAFGRLLRRIDDRGVFVMLDRGLPSRLLGAFPEEVDVRRIGLAEAVAETKGFLSERP